MVPLATEGRDECLRHRYSVTGSGLKYLQRVGDEDSVGGEEHNELWALLLQQETSVRESLRELLLDMDPFAFEHLVKRLLEEMDYRKGAALLRRAGREEKRVQLTLRRRGRGRGKTSGTVASA
jgi:hypothetical protein